MIKIPILGIVLTISYFEVYSAIPPPSFGFNKDMCIILMINVEHETIFNQNTKKNINNQYYYELKE